MSVIHTKYAKNTTIKIEPPGNLWADKKYIDMLC